MNLPDDEQIVFRGHPAWILGHPFLFCASVLLIVLGVSVVGSDGVADDDAAVAGMMILLGALIIFRLWLGALCTTLTITDKRTIYRGGLLSRFETELFHEDIRGTSLRQKISERIFLIGTVSISSAASGDDNIKARRFFRPDRIKKIVQQYRKR
ncbi:MAG: PH domain-containing protein [Planctomycetaceae bacterium]|jgi:uncharacterized membrane protein YdbT with pleckstrin-like domain|nr:PH domain-containing protein [Planctomycetaceae bacterium]